MSVHPDDDFDVYVFKKEINAYRRLLEYAKKNYSIEYEDYCKTKSINDFSSDVEFMDYVSGLIEKINCDNFPILTNQMIEDWEESDEEND